MIKMSATKVKTVQSCKRQYYYKYIERLETKPNARAVLGRCIHKAIELGFQGEDPFQVYAQQWAEQSQEVEDRRGFAKIYDEGLKMLVLYDFSQTAPIEMEIGFELPFPNREHPICMMEGIIDQIFSDHVIVDLKTSLRKPLQGVLDNSAQFVLYAWAYETLFGVQPKIYWHHLRTGDRIEAHVHDEEKFQNLYDTVLHTVQLRTQTESIRDYHQNIGFECQFCSFRATCLGTEN